MSFPYSEAREAPKAKGWPARELGMTVWAAGAVRLAAAVVTLTPHLHFDTAQDIANAVWAAAVVLADGTRFRVDFAEFAGAPAEFAACLWALAVAGDAFPAERAAAAAIAFLPTLPPAELAMVVWSFGKAVAANAALLHTRTTAR